VKKMIFNNVKINFHQRLQPKMNYKIKSYKNHLQTRQALKKRAIIKKPSDFTHIRFINAQNNISGITRYITDLS